MKGRKPTAKEQKHMNEVRSLGCIVCFNNGYPFTPAEIHNVHGKTKENAHFQVLPLCPIHHRTGGHEGDISRHPNKARFEEAYGTEEELLEQVRQLLLLEPHEREFV